MESQVSTETVAKYLGDLNLTILSLREQLSKANATIEELQHQLLVYQKRERGEDIS